MKASVGDWLVVTSATTGRPPKRARILEVRGPDGAPPYIVRWLRDGRLNRLSRPGFPYHDARRAGRRFSDGQMLKCPPGGGA